MQSRGATRFFVIFAKTTNDKDFFLPTASINNKLNWHKKVKRKNLITNQIGTKYNLTIYEDKKCLPFFCRKNIMKFLHSELVRY